MTPTSPAKEPLGTTEGEILLRRAGEPKTARPGAEKALHMLGDATAITARMKADIFSPGQKKHGD